GWLNGRELAVVGTLRQLRMSHGQQQDGTQRDQAAQHRHRIPPEHRLAGYLTIASSSTSKINVELGLIEGGAPRSPYAMLAGHTRRLLPPTFMSCRPSV